MQTQAKIGDILYDRNGKSGSNYKDLEPGKDFGTGSRYLVLTTNH